jgi:hypothetical protein
MTRSSSVNVNDDIDEYDESTNNRNERKSDRVSWSKKTTWSNQTYAPTVQRSMGRPAATFRDNRLSEHHQRLARNQLYPTVPLNSDLSRKPSIPFAQSTYTSNTSRQYARDLPLARSKTNSIRSQGKRTLSHMNVRAMSCFYFLDETVDVELGT